MFACGAPNRMTRLSLRLPPHIRLHDFRHSYASTALARGETVLTIGRLLGHRDPARTLKYLHLSDTMVREAAEAVGAVLEG